MAAKTLLVGDDVESMRGILTAIAQEVGFAVKQASHGQAGLEMVQAGGIDAIVSDWNMPVMDGGQFVRALRAAGHLMPVIMVTVEADQNRVRELIQTGIQGYIVKPFKAETVHRALEKLLQRL